VAEIILQRARIDALFR
jgi:hypothetical protein